MDRKVVLLFCINDFNRFKFVHQHAGIAYLTAAFGIERGLVQYNLVQCLVFLLNLPVTQDGCFVFRIVIAYEFGCAFLQRNPVAGFNSGGVACALFCCCISASNSLMSAVMPFSRRISSVRSSGKPKVS